MSFGDILESKTYVPLLKLQTSPSKMSRSGFSVANRTLQTKQGGGFWVAPSSSQRGHLGPYTQSLARASDSPQMTTNRSTRLGTEEFMEPRVPKAGNMKWRAGYASSTSLGTKSEMDHREGVGGWRGVMVRKAGGQKMEMR